MKGFDKKNLLRNVERVGLYHTNPFISIDELDIRRMYGCLNICRFMVDYLDDMKYEFSAWEEQRDLWRMTKLLYFMGVAKRIREIESKMSNELDLLTKQAQEIKLGYE